MKTIKVNLSVRVRIEIKTAMERLAEIDSRTLSQEVEFALGEWLMQRKGQSQRKGTRLITKV